ncbi:hypothetical protein ACFYG5_02040 [Rhodanobacter sp. FW102-FHT14D07]
MMMTVDAIRRQSAARKEAQSAQQQAPAAWQRPLPQSAPQKEASAAQQQAQQRPRMTLATAIGAAPQKQAQGSGQGSGGQGQLSKPTHPSFYNPISTGEIAPPKKAQKRGMSM